MTVPTESRSANYTPEPITARGTADGAGACILKTPPVDWGRRWLISYVTITTSGAAVPTVDLFIDEVDLPNLFDGTDSGQAALAEYNPARRLSQGQVLVAQWAGATAGAECSLRVEYDVEAT